MQLFFVKKFNQRTLFFNSANRSGNSDSDGSNEFENVCSIYTQLYNFTKGLEFKVQVIVTDHADKLNIYGLSAEEFENKIIAARWRKPGEGFIMGVKDNNSYPNNVLFNKMIVSNKNKFQK